MKANRIIALAGTAVIMLTGVLGTTAAGAATAWHTNSCVWSAGYGMQATDINAPIHQVSARWVEPKVIVHGYYTNHAAIMVGYNGGLGDGLSTEMPEIGTEADSAGGVPHYYAWYSPGHSNGNNGNYRQMLRYSVRPGDHMSAWVTSVNARSTVKLTDVRYRRQRPPLTWTFTKHLSGRDNSIAWTNIEVGVAKPDQLKVSDFGTVQFTNVKVNGVVIGAHYPNFTRLDWIDSHSNMLAKTSRLGSSGDSFSITWKRGK